MIGRRCSVGWRRGCRWLSWLTGLVTAAPGCRGCCAGGSCRRRPLSCWPRPFGRALIGRCRRWSLGCTAMSCSALLRWVAGSVAGWCGPGLGYWPWGCRFAPAGGFPAGPEPDPAQLRASYVGQHRTLVQVAAELGCSTGRVKAGLAAAGIVVRAGGRPASAAALLPLTQALLRELCERQQLTMRQVADRFGGSQFRIARALDRFGIVRRRPGTRPLPALPADAGVLRRLYVEQRPDDTAVGGRFGVPAWRVTQRRRELGIQRLPVPPPHLPPVPPPPAAELRRLYSEQGLPIAVIAARYRTSLPKVRGWLKDADRTIRPWMARADRAVLDRSRPVEPYSDRQWTARAGRGGTRQHRQHRAARVARSWRWDPPRRIPTEHPAAAGRGCRRRRSPVARCVVRRPAAARGAAPAPDSPETPARDDR